MPSAPLRLRCEFVSNPLGVTCAKPRLSWWVDDPRPAELQSAYEILAAPTLDALGQDSGELWFSGRVSSNLTAHVEWDGSPLASGQRVWWKVRTFDSDGLSSPWSEPAFFEMGLLDEADWQARWVAAPLRGSRSRGVQAVALRREFEAPAPAVRARLYVAALGDYHVELNGSELPGAGWHATLSDFEQEVYYQTFDVTELLNEGDNAIGVLLADGYFAGYIPGAGRAVYGDRPQLRLQLQVEYADRMRETLATDHQWRWRPSWILAADPNLGEHIDARQRIAGWSEAGLDDRHWAPVDVLPDRAGVMRAQCYPEFGVQQVLRPLTLPRTSRAQERASSVYDFGVQLLGRARIDLRSLASDEIVLSYSLDGQFSTASRDTCTSAGAQDEDQSQTESVEARFAAHAFRYLRVEYTAGVTNVTDVYALRLAAPDVLSVSFRSDHPSLNQLFEVIRNSVRAVALSVPMRGLGRAERVPDVGYAGTWVPFVAQAQSAHALVAKWMADIKLASQTQAQASPFVPAIPARGRGGQGDEIARFETFVRVLWALYRYQSDVEILRQCYPELRVAALSYRHRFADLLRESSQASLYGGQASGLIATSTLYGALRIAGRIAGVLTHLGDHELIDALAVDVRSAFRRRYLSRDGHLVGDTQSAQVAALYHGLLEPEERVLAERRLVDLLQANAYHADVSPAVLHALLPVLTRAGRLDMAYMVLLQTSPPSWLASVSGDGNALDQPVGVIDVANVGLLEWLVESLVGISLHEDYSPDRNGQRSVKVRPMPPLGAQFLAGSPVQFVEAGLETLHGQYEVKWWIREDCFELELVIPPGCTASVTMPDDIEQQVQSGRHRFVMDFDAGGDGVPTLLDMAGR